MLQRGKFFIRKLLEAKRKIAKLASTFIINDSVSFNCKYIYLIELYKYFHAIFIVLFSRLKLLNVNCNANLDGFYLTIKLMRVNQINTMVCFLIAY